MIQRYAIHLAYCGTHYCGWQSQLNGISIQEEIEQQLAKMNGKQPVSIVGCGRTDAGVHAHFFVAHVDLELQFDPEDWKFKLNKMLSKDIVVFKIQPVSSEFHARFAATRRTYKYFVHFQKSPFLIHSHRVFGQLNVEAMNEAAQFLIGRHDFTSFSKLHTDVKTNICTVDSAFWSTTENGLFFEISADRFLRNMVRAVVGTLLEVGSGKLQPKDLISILEQKDRSKAKTSVPANGLFLWNIEYPSLLLPL